MAENIQAVAQSKATQAVAAYVYRNLVAISTDQYRAAVAAAADLIIANPNLTADSSEVQAKIRSTLN